MTPIHFITAVSRPWNLPAVLRSMEASAAKANTRARWILIFDGPAGPPAWVRSALGWASLIDIAWLVHPGGASKFGIPHKNIGIDAAGNGWFLILDDDTLVHPRYLVRISEEISQRPDKGGFVSGQRRWDPLGDLKAVPGCLRPGAVDNGMLTLSGRFVGALRQNPELAGCEDGNFAMMLNDKNPAAFHYIDEQLSLYNYLDILRRTGGAT